MSGENTEEPNRAGGGTRKGREPQGDTLGKAQVEPTPKRLDFFEWLEHLFDGVEHFPEKIDVRVVEGKKLDRHGPRVEQKIYAPKEVKPSKEKLVNLSNAILNKVQNETNLRRTRVVYGVYASHFSRDDNYYERFLIECHPQKLHLTERPEGEEGGEDDETSLKEKFGVQVLGHQERMVSLLGAGYEGMLDRDDRTIERLLGRIVHLEGLLEKKNEQLERALSNELDREERRVMVKLKAQAAEKVFEMGVALVPPLVNSLMGKSLIPNAVSPEITTLQNFFKEEKAGGKLTIAQANAAFGIWSEDGKTVVHPGVLTADQANVLAGVTRGDLNPDLLDRLVDPDDPLHVTKEQMAALAMGCGFSMDQLAPIQLIFEGRYNRLMERKKKGDIK